MTRKSRKSSKGDTVVIDFDGSVDGEAFSGGKAENYELKLGSGQFIPGFEEQLEGREAGEEVDVEVVFPGDYHAEELAGKPALFKCKVHEIKKEILPEIDDELASDVSDFETLAEYKEDLKAKLQEKAAETDLSVMKDRVLEQLYKMNEIEVPAVMIQNEIENMLYDMNQSSEQGSCVRTLSEWKNSRLRKKRFASSWKTSESSMEWMSIRLRRWQDPILKITSEKTLRQRRLSTGCLITQSR